MKKKLLFVVFALLFMGAKADQRHSVLDLRMHDQAMFIATLDNMCYETPMRTMSFERLRPGMHHLYVARVILNGWGEVILKEIVFDDMIRIPRASRVNAMIGRTGHFRIMNITPVTPAFVQHSYYDPYQAPVQCGPIAMSDHEFSMLMHTIRNSSFDRTRLNIALFALERNHFTSAQVSVLMSLMTFESTKLTLAKKAFSKTVDPQVYYAVYEQFTFDSSIRELNSFIGWG
jgi:hypothetical protein